MLKIKENYHPINWKIKIRGFKDLLVDTFVNYDSFAIINRCKYSFIKNKGDPHVVQLGNVELLIWNPGIIDDYWSV